MTLSEFTRRGIASLQSVYPPREARNIVLMLTRERLGVEDYTYLVEPLRPISDIDAARLEDDVRRLLASEPVQYVLGRGDFFGRSFKLTPDVLIPRPETELLVQEALKFALDKEKPLRILDLCTGSGCIAWTLKMELPDAEVVATDISEKALELARSQFQGPGPEFHRADLLGEIPFGGQFDIIVSNPPYIMEKEKSEMMPNVLEWEPGIALFVPDSDPLLFYKAISRWCSALLAPGGCCFVEINEKLGEETTGLFKADGFKNVQAKQDLSGRNRIVSFG